MTSIPTRKIEMSTEQKQDIHCGTCTVKGDIGACLATPCSVRSSWFANSQSQEIERLKAELTRPVTRNGLCKEAAAMLRQQAEQIESLKADAERFVMLAECVISSDLPHDLGVAETVDEVRAAIDAMKGKS